MSKVILKSNQTATPDEAILGPDAYGNYQVTLEVAGSTPVKWQRRVSPESTWKTVVYKGEEMELTDEAETLEVALVKSFDYRCLTATAGAEVWIAPHDPHGS